MKVPVEIDELEIARRLVPLMEARLMRAGFVGRMARAVAAHQEKEWAGIGEAAREHGVSAKTMRRWAEAGTIEAKRVRGRWRIKRKPETGRLKAE